MPRARCGSPASSADPDALRSGATAQAFDPAPDAPGSACAPATPAFGHGNFDSQLAERLQAITSDQAAVSAGVHGSGSLRSSVSSGESDSASRQAFTPAEYASRRAS